MNQKKKSKEYLNETKNEWILDQLFNFANNHKLVDGNWLRKEEYIKLAQHVENNYFVKWNREKEQWEVKCWLGEEKTGILFSVSINQIQYNKKGEPFSPDLMFPAGLDTMLGKLVKDMYEFLYTSKESELK